MTELKVEPVYLELLAKNCKSLISLKISECDLSELIGFFQTAKTLEEFAGGAFYEVGEYTKYEKVKFPPRLCLLGLTYMGTNEMSVIFPFSATLKKLDLQYTLLTTEDHCQIIAKCPNLLVLEVLFSVNICYIFLYLELAIISFQLTMWVFSAGEECDRRSRTRNCLPYLQEAAKTPN